MTIHLVINTVIVKQYFHLRQTCYPYINYLNFQIIKGGNDLWHVIKLYLLEVVIGSAFAHAIVAKGLVDEMAIYRY